MNVRILALPGLRKQPRHQRAAQTTRIAPSVVVVPGLTLSALNAARIYPVPVPAGLAA